jgi:thiamine-phosphate pyrophosphorylase
MQMVHSGLTDTTVTEARSILGDHKIIGGTANTIEDIKQRIDENCDYIV